MRDAMERMNMSARAYDRILKVARTIADLEACADVLDHHIMEAIAYRNLDRPTYMAPTYNTENLKWYFRFSVSTSQVYSLSLYVTCRRSVP